jgi:hypothetical protein
MVDILPLLTLAANLQSRARMVLTLVRRVLSIGLIVGMLPTLQFMILLQIHMQTLRLRLPAIDVNDPRPAAAGNNGLISVLAGFGVKQLREAYNNSSDKSDAKLAAETFMRFVFGRDFVMKELLETIFGFGHDF